MIILSNN